MVNQDFAKRNIKKVTMFCLIRGLTLQSFSPIGVYAKNKRQIADGLERAEFSTWFEVENVLNDYVNS